MNVGIVLDDRRIANAVIRKVYHVGLRDISLVEAAELLEVLCEENDKAKGATTPWDWFNRNVKANTVKNG